MPERLSARSILPNSFVNWEQIGSTTWVYVKEKKTIFHLFFPDLGKTEKLSQSILQKLQNHFVNWEKLGRSA